MCVRFVFSYSAQLSYAVFSVHLVFLIDEIVPKQTSNSVILKSFPNTLITLEQMCVLKTRVLPQFAASCLHFCLDMWLL